MVTLSNKAKLHHEYTLQMRDTFLISNRSNNTLTKVEFSLPRHSLILLKYLFLTIWRKYIFLPKNFLKTNSCLSWMKSWDFWCIKSKNTVLMWALKKLLMNLVVKTLLIWWKLNKLIENYWLFIITKKLWARFYKIVQMHLIIRLKISSPKYSKKIT